MNKKIHTAAAVTALCCAAALQAAAPMADIQGGSYRPLYLKKDTPMIAVKRFKLDKYPVTNQEFYQFVRQHPQWRRGRPARRQADATYLKHWAADGKGGFAPRREDANKPVTQVSWFAANAYCRAQGKRLPTIDQWEYAGQASPTAKNGASDKNFNRIILQWYEEGSTRGLTDVGKSRPNYWGVYDMHGLIWEWTEDFNSSLLNAGSADSSQFCGGGAAGSTDPSNYAAFMRYGLRTSLQADFTLRHLGFRCAQ